MLTLGPIVTILEAVTFLLTVGLTRYVSLGSILVVIELVIDIAVLGQRGYYGMSQGHLLEFYLVCTALSLMAIYRHRTNIKRLLSGTENKNFSEKIMVFGGEEIELWQKQESSAQEAGEQLWRES